MRGQILGLGRSMALPTISALLLATFMVGCSHMNPPAREQAQFVDGANRVVVTRQVIPDDLTKDAPALSLYVDARDLLQDDGFTFVTNDKTSRVIETAPRDFGDGLTLKLHLVANPAPGGSKLIAEGLYLDPATNTWVPATWGNGLSGEAFAKMYGEFVNLPHSDVATAAVAEENVAATQ